MRIVIVGANFGNKGAQSMLFTIVAVLRRAYSDAKIFFAHADNFPCLEENFSFNEIYYAPWQLKISQTNVDTTPPPTACQRLVCRIDSNYKDCRFNY